MILFTIIKRYGFLGSFYLIRCWLLTKLFYPKARLIRFPFDCRNFKLMKLGKGFTTGRNCRIEVEAKSDKIVLEIGENVQLNDNVHITASHSLKIGNNVLIASKVYISDTSHGNYQGLNQSSCYEPPVKRILKSQSVVIGDNVWLGDGVCVLPGVHIGFGSIVGANSVVTKDIPANSIAVGIPARVIKIYDEEKGEWRAIE